VTEPGRGPGKKKFPEKKNFGGWKEDTDSPKNYIGRLGTVGGESEKEGAGAV